MRRLVKTNVLLSWFGFEYVLVSLGVAGEHGCHVRCVSRAKGSQGNCR